jgi:hypothetical protein
MQVSAQLRYEWHFEGRVPVLGVVEVCGAQSSGCTSQTDFNPILDHREYVVCINSQLAAGGADGSYTMLTSLALTHVGRLSEYEAVLAYLISSSTSGGGGGGGGEVGEVGVVANEESDMHTVDLTAAHRLPALLAACSGGAGVRVCQSNELIPVAVGVMCQSDKTAGLEECDMHGARF